MKQRKTEHPIIFSTPMVQAISLAGKVIIDAAPAGWFQNNKSSILEIPENLLQ